MPLTGDAAVLDEIDTLIRRIAAAYWDGESNYAVGMSFLGEVGEQARVDSWQELGITDACRGHEGSNVEDWRWGFHGTEPFWGGTLSDDRVTLFHLDMFDKSFGAPVMTAEGDTLRAEANGEGGDFIKMEFEAVVCDDGMADIYFPYRVRVETRDTQYSGCARRFR